MPEFSFNEHDDSYAFFVLSEVSESIFEYCFLGFRWLISFLLAGNFVNTHALVDWFVEIALIDFLLNRVLTLFFDFCLSQDTNLQLFKIICSRMLSAWIISLLLHQSLLIILFSQVLYWLFTTYSQFFSRRIIESISVFYYFSNWWLLFPVIVNLSVSLIYIIDMMLSTNMLFKLMQFKFIKRFLEEWGINTLIDVKSLLKENIQIHEYSNKTQYHGLSVEENLNFHILKQRYLHPNSKEFIGAQIEDLKAYLAEEYYAHQIQMTIHHMTYSLPLEWRDFLNYRLRVSPFEQVEMYHAYLHHEYHSAWRLLSQNNDWVWADPQNILNKQSFLEPKNLEFLTTIWIALKKQYQEHGEAQLFKTKADMFIKVLARVNRFGNHQNQFYLNFFRNDNEADKIGPISLLYTNLMALVSEKHQETYISQGIVQHLLDSFAKSTWVTQMLKQDRSELQYLYHIWQGIIENKYQYSEYHHFFYPYNFSKSHREDFILKMNILFGKNWLHTASYLNLMDSFFKLDPNQVESHASVNTKIFTDAMKTSAEHFNLGNSLVMSHSLTV